jgi:hypothetical protein
MLAVDGDEPEMISKLLELDVDCDLQNEVATSILVIIVEERMGCLWGEGVG